MSTETELRGQALAAPGRRSPGWRAALFLGFCAPLAASAAQLGDPDSLWSVELHGFVSQGFIYTTHQNNYLAATRTGSFEFSEIGLNVTKQLTENLRFGMQLFSRDLGPLGNYSLRADWYYVDYRFRDWLGLRAGRVKLPFGLYNDTSDVDAARVPVLMPQSLYPAQNRDFLLAQTGFELYGRLPIGKVGTLDYRAYAGAIFIELPDRLPPGSVTLLDLNVPYVFGGRLLWETPYDGLRLGFSAQYLRLDTHLIVPPSTPAEVSINALLWVASAEYSGHDLLVAIEYSRWRTSTVSSSPAFAAGDNESERGYAMVSYRLLPWLQPGLYYSMLYPKAEVRKSRANEQHDLAVTLRFDVTSFLIVKLEGHFMAGTAALSPSLNDGRPLTSLAPYWGAFFVKTTGYF